MNETDLRLAVLSKFLKECNTSHFEAIILTGSLVFGKYFSIHSESDIDIICVMDISKVHKLVADPLFREITIDKDLIRAFEKGMIDRFWLDYYLGGIKINIGIWDKRFIDAFIMGQASKHMLGSTNATIRLVQTLDATGKTVTYTPTMERYGSIYIKIFQLQHEGLLLGSPSYNNLVASELLYDPDHRYKFKIATLIQNLNKQNGDIWQEHFLQYVIQKSSPNYLIELKKRLKSPL